MEIKNNEVQYKIVRNFEDFKDSVMEMYNSSVPIQNKFLLKYPGKHWKS
jgi:hypothetical protein